MICSMEFAIVDLTVDEPSAPPSPEGVSGQAAGQYIGDIDTTAVAAALEALRADLAAYLDDSASSSLRLDEVSVKLTLTAEGRVAFVAKGAAEACIEVSFRRR